MSLVDADTIRDQARAWFADHWDPHLPLGSWWELLAGSGWGFPTWPAEWFGRGLPVGLAAVVDEERKRGGAAPPPQTIGAKVIAPLLVERGTEAQKARYLWETITGRAVWCELFSEPGAGSDLASLSTRAERDGDRWPAEGVKVWPAEGVKVWPAEGVKVWPAEGVKVWRVNGQKVWSSGAPIATWGLLAARTAPRSIGRRGISCFVIDMRQPGVDARPLRVMTGEAKFAEVFFAGAVVDDDQAIGSLDAGWEVVKATLSLERQLMGSTSAGALGDNSKPPDLAQAAGDVSRLERAGRQRGAMVSGVGAMSLVRTLLDRYGGAEDLVTRQEVAHLHTLSEVTRYTAMRARAAGTDASLLKLLSGRATVALRELVLHIAGPSATLAGEDAAFGGVVQRLTLVSPSASIMVGTDEIQRNVIGERVLGLPREPWAD